MCWESGLYKEKKQAKTLWAHGIKVGLGIRPLQGGGAVSFYWRRMIAVVNAKSLYIQNKLLDGVSRFTIPRIQANDNDDDLVDPDEFEWQARA